MELLSKIQKELKAPKQQRNSFGNYNYRSCEDILEAVKPLLGTGTLVINDEVVMIGERYYVKATATLSDGEKQASASAYAREQEKKVNKQGQETMDHAQITGSTSSYARKYALNGLFCIDDTKDADTQDNTKDVKEEKAPANSPAAYRAEIKGLLADLGKTPKTVAEASEVVKALTGLDFKVPNYPQIAEMLKIKKEELTN